MSNHNIDDKLPQRPTAHVIGDRAVTAFLYKIQPAWIHQESKRDYGWDIFVTIVQNENVTDDFFVQLKGHEKPTYIENNQYISEPIDIKTLNFLLQKPMPSMLCVCDVSNEEEKLFYVWINEDIRRIDKESPDRRQQETVSVRIPVNNMIIRDATIYKAIEDYVVKFHNELRNNKEIMNVFASSLGIDKESLGNLPKDAVLEMARPTLEKAGLIDDSSEDMESYSPEAQELLRKINDVSTLFKTFQYDIAKQRLDELSSRMEQAPDSLKAKYLNSYGVYYSSHGEFAKALDFFQRASNLSPQNHRIATNNLLTQFEYLRRNNLFENLQASRFMFGSDSELDE